MFQRLLVSQARRTVSSFRHVRTFSAPTSFFTHSSGERSSQKFIPRRTMTSEANRNLHYDDIVALSSNKEVVLIDVREPAEIQETGVLPGSTHIPLGDIPSALNLDAEVFHKKYGIMKPSVETPLVFSCRSGKRSQVALDKALSMGYSKSRHYAGGWLDWEKHTKN